MKYIITESQYSSTINTFFNMIFEPHVETRSGISNSLIFWLDDNGKVFTAIHSDKYFIVRKDVWNDIKKWFSLDEKKLKGFLGYWLGEKYGLGHLIPLSDKEFDEKMFGK